MTREQLIEFARLCVRQASLTSNKDVADLFWRMAQEYLDKATKLDRSTIVATAKSDRKSASSQRCFD
jgi:hypothetical protein